MIFIATDSSLLIHTMNELQKRIFTGLFGAIGFSAAIIWNEWSYFVLFFLLCLLIMLEFYKLLKLDGNAPLRTFGVINGLFIFTLSFLIQKFDLDGRLYSLIFVGLAAVFFFKLYDAKPATKKPFTDIAFTFLGIIYIAFPLSLFNLAVFSDSGYNYQIVLGTLIILWASDVGAYFAGKSLGKHKLFKRVSPKKTWEGSIGGLVLALLIAVGLSYIFTSFTLIYWLIMACIIVVVGSYGDLFESLFKRSIAIKDSGNVLPGHGGFLDRFDGFLFVAPFVAVFITVASIF